MRDECLNCDCTNAGGCRLEARPRRRYTMCAPRGRRGPYKGATRTALAKLQARIQANEKPATVPR